MSEPLNVFVQKKLTLTKSARFLSKDAVTIYVGSKRLDFTLNGISVTNEKGQCSGNHVFILNELKEELEKE